MEAKTRKVSTFATKKAATQYASTLKAFKIPVHTIRPALGSKTAWEVISDV